LASRDFQAERAKIGLYGTVATLLAVQSTVAVYGKKNASTATLAKACGISPVKWLGLRHVRVTSL
jgi:hypothetical protein